MSSTAKSGDKLSRRVIKQFSIKNGQVFISTSSVKLLCKLNRVQNGQ